MRYNIPENKEQQKEVVEPVLDQVLGGRKKEEFKASFDKLFAGYQDAEAFDESLYDRMYEIYEAQDTDLTKEELFPGKHDHASFRSAFEKLWKSLNYAMGFDVFYEELRPAQDQRLKLCAKLEESGQMKWDDACRMMNTLNEMDNPIYAKKEHGYYDQVSVIERMLGNGKNIQSICQDLRNDVISKGSYIASRTALLEALSESKEKDLASLVSLYDPKTFRPGQKPSMPAAEAEKASDEVKEVPAENVQKSEKKEAPTENEQKPEKKDEAAEKQEKPAAEAEAKADAQKDAPAEPAPAKKDEKQDEADVDRASRYHIPENKAQQKEAVEPVLDQVLGGRKKEEFKASFDKLFAGYQDAEAFDESLYDRMYEIYEAQDTDLTKEELFPGKHDHASFRSAFEKLWKSLNYAMGFDVFYEELRPAQDQRLKLCAKLEESGQMKWDDACRMMNTLNEMDNPIYAKKEHGYYDQVSVIERMLGNGKNIQSICQDLRNDVISKGSYIASRTALLEALSESKEKDLASLVSLYDPKTFRPGQKPSMPAAEAEKASDEVKEVPAENVQKSEKKEAPTENEQKPEKKDEAAEKQEKPAAEAEEAPVQAEPRESIKQEVPEVQVQEAVPAAAVEEAPQAMQADEAVQHSEAYKYLESVEKRLQADPDLAGYDPDYLANAEKFRAELSALGMQKEKADLTEKLSDVQKKYQDYFQPAFASYDHIVQNMQEMSAARDQIAETLQAVGDLTKSGWFSRDKKEIERFRQVTEVVQAYADDRSNVKKAHVAYEACREYMAGNMKKDGKGMKSGSKDHNARNQTVVRLLELMEKLPEFEGLSDREEKKEPKGLDGWEEITHDDLKHGSKYQKLNFKELEASLAKHSSDTKKTKNKTKAFSDLNKRIEKNKKAEQKPKNGKGNPKSK